MVQNIVRIIIAIGEFFGTLKRRYLFRVRENRENKQTKLEVDVKKEVEQGKVDDLNKRLMK
jgi:hypothetical protein